MGATLVTVSTDTQFVHLAWKDHEKENPASVAEAGLGIKQWGLQS